MILKPKSNGTQKQWLDKLTASHIKLLHLTYTKEELLIKVAAMEGGVSHCSFSRVATQCNPENTIGSLTMAGKCVHVLVTPASWKDIGLRDGGEMNLAAGI